MCGLQEGALVQVWTAQYVSSEHVCCFDLNMHACLDGGGHRYRDTVGAGDPSECPKCEEGLLSKEGSTQAGDCITHSPHSPLSVTHPHAVCELLFICVHVSFLLILPAAAWYCPCMHRYTKDTSF